MIYLNSKDILDIGKDWAETIRVIEDTVHAMDQGDYAQPIKPYLRYKDMSNRIIAMPAFIGGPFDKAGLKWIASFPGNLKLNKPRANSVIILNNSHTGETEAVINTALLSVIRTVSVSGLIVKYFDRVRHLKEFNVGIVGWGPIGKGHAEMFLSQYGNRIAKIYVYDIRGVEVEDVSNFGDKLEVVNDWEQAYKNSDVFVTCTVSEERYISGKPKERALLLNVSLRDYKVDIYEEVKGSIIVDDWQEVCRENTDIELMNLHKGLAEHDVTNIIELVCYNGIKKFDDNQPVMFNPMGLSVFDISIATYYTRKAMQLNIGTNLD